MRSSALIDDMGVANVGFLIENLGKDAGELQYLRELVQNAFESILRAQRSDGRVEIDFEEIKGVRKLRITDNGIGMTPEGVAENINRLSATTGVQAFDKNFGIGAKITAAVRNPHGVMYKCWKDGEGSVTVLGSADGRYGRLGFGNSLDDRVDYWLPLPEDDKHDVIKESGVSVVLLGRGDDDDTSVAPPGADLPSQWVAAYLERRYFSVPDGTTVKVLRPVEIYDSARDQHRSIYDTINGQKHYLDKHSDHHDRIELPETSATVWWWLLTEDIVSGGKTWNNRGHVAALYQNELYEVRAGLSRASALKDFGIYAGFNRVAIYVEPTTVLGANTSRTAVILKGGTPIDYAEIGALFAEKMPDALSAYMAGQVSAEHGDHRKAIKKNLKEVEDALRQARYRRTQRGRLDDLEVENGGRSPRTGEARIRSTPTSGGRAQDATGRIGDEYLRKARLEMERKLRGQEIAADPLPRIVWDESGGAVQSGRAATYTRTSHVVTASTEFEFYKDVLDWAVQEGRGRVAGQVDEAALRQICEDELRRWFEEALSSAVVALRPMAHDARWGPMVYGTGLSDEGLTAAVTSHRWLLLSAIKRGLAGRLGRPREAAASDD